MTTFNQILTLLYAYSCTGRVAHILRKENNFLYNEFFFNIFCLFFNVYVLRKKEEPYSKRILTRIDVLNHFTFTFASRLCLL